MKQECWPTKIENYLSFIPKYKACWWHDKRYEFSKIKNEYTRFKIDRIFLYQMLIEKPEWYNKIVAHIYYILVRLFGWIIFYQK